jgi:hypothetical protein
MAALFLTQCKVMGPPAAPPHVLVLPVSRFAGIHGHFGNATQVVVHRSVPAHKLETAFPSFERLRLDLFTRRPAPGQGVIERHNPDRDSASTTHGNQVRTQSLRAKAPARRSIRRRHRAAAFSDASAGDLPVKRSWQEQTHWLLVCLSLGTHHRHRIQNRPTMQGHGG